MDLDLRVSGYALQALGPEAKPRDGVMMLMKRMDRQW